jgi:hypothetical protein
MKNLLKIAACLFLCAPVAHAQLYTVTDLGDFKAGIGNSFPTYINNLGQITLKADTNAGQAPALWLPSAAYGLNPGLNNLNTHLGITGGVYGISTTGYLAADNDRWDLNLNTSVNLGNFPGGGGPLRSDAINTAGNITGFGAQANATPQSFHWNGSTTPSGGLTGPTGFSAGHAINDYGIGEIAGYSRTIPDRAFAWIDPANPDARYPWVPSGIFDLGSLNGPGGTAHAYGINDNLYSVGDSQTSTGTATHAILYNPAIFNGPNPSHFTMFDLGAILGNGGDSVAKDINNFNDIVGYSDTGAGNHATAWLLSLNQGLIDLNNHLDATGIGWTLQEAVSINDSGWIIGTGTNPNGRSHAYLLRPVPEPTSAALLLLATTFCCSTRSARRRRSC